MTHTFMRSATLAAGLVCIGNAASAQSLCGGAGDGGQWIGGSEGASDIATSNAYREQMALVLAGNRYVSLFTLSDAARVRVEAAGRGAGDPLIDILDAAGTIIASDDDSGGEGASRAELDLDPGTYCVAVSSYDGTPMTAFVRVGTIDHDPLTAGIGQDPAPLAIEPEAEDPATTPTEDESCADATDIGTLLDQPLTYTASANGTPFLGFTLSEATPVTITAANEDADPVITLYDAQETYLAENDDFDGLNSQIDMTDALAPGAYCLSVSALSDASAPIDITIRAYDAEAAQRDLYASGVTPPPMDGTVQIVDLGTLQTRLREDATIGADATWFQVTMDSPGLMLMEAIDGSGDGDPYVRVFDDLGRPITENDDYGDGLDSLVVVRANAGTYLISVVQVSEGVSGLTRMVFEKYQAAQ